MAPRGGMETFADAIAVEIVRLGVHVRTGTHVESIEPVAGAPGDPLRLHLADGETIEADGVILATPAAVTAGLIRPHAPDVARLLGELRYASVAHTALAYDASALPPLPTGTGFLVPRPEGKLMTACTFLDRKWPERRAFAYEQGGGVDPLADAVVIKCSTGRIDDTRFQGFTDDQLVAALHGELARILGFRAEPIASRVVRVDHGLPQYEPGHPERMAVATAEAQQALPGLSLVGAAYRGASVPLCIRDGRGGADAQLSRLGVRTPHEAIAP